MKKIKTITIVPIFSVITVVCSQIAIPIPFTPIPINLGIFAVFLSSAILKKKDSVLSQLIYILLGLIGLPVFVGFGSGFGTILGPTGGFILSYIVVSFIISLLIERLQKNFWCFVIAMLIGLAICYLFGVSGFILYSKCNLITALMATVFPFVIFDLVKIFLASILAIRLKNLQILKY